jgi:hypothetical protein
METNYKKFRKVPPYMTKTGVQIGLLYQEPFEARIDEDGFALQRALLRQKHKDVNKPYVIIDSVIVAVCVVTLIVLIMGGFYGFI